MKLNLDEMIKNMDLSYLDDIEFSDEEIDELIKDVDLEKIKSMTLDKLKLNNPEVTSPRNTKMPNSQNTKGYSVKRSKFLYKITLIATLILLIGSMVFAYQKGIFEQIFGINIPLTENEVIRVNKSQISDGIKMTLSEILPGETDALAIIVFEKETGEAFSNEELILSNQLDVYLDDKLIKTGSSGMRFSEDKTQILYTLEFSDNDNLRKKKLSIKAKGLYYTKKESENYNIKLNKVFESSLAEISDDDIKHITENSDSTKTKEEQIFQKLLEKMKNQTKSMPMPYQKQYNGLSFAGVGFDKDGIYLANYIPDIESENTIAFSGVFDNRKNEIVKYRSITTYQALPHKVNFTFIEGIKKEDLPYLTPIVRNEYPKQISNGSFDISYTFPDRALTFNKEIDQICSLEFGDKHMIKLEISVLGVYLYGETLTMNEFDHEGPQIEIQPDVEIVMKDESKIELTKEGGHQINLVGSNGKPISKYQYRILNNIDREYKFIDNKLLNQIDAIIIDGKEIKLQEIDN